MLIIGSKIRISIKNTNGRVEITGLLYGIYIRGLFTHGDLYQSYLKSPDELKLMASRA
jgi:hypothetical protein